jgi:hypothetical protein
MTEKTSALEKLTSQGFKRSFNFNGFQIWAKNDDRVLYDEKNRDIIFYNKNEDLAEYINKFAEIKRK